MKTCVSLYIFCKCKQECTNVLAVLVYPYVLFVYAYLLGEKLMI